MAECASEFGQTLKLNQLALLLRVHFCISVCGHFGVIDYEYLASFVIFVKCKMCAVIQHLLSAAIA